jgi:RNA recognition motif-containing protein
VPGQKRPQGQGNDRVQRLIMGKRLFVGNLPYSATADDLRALFAELGEVTDVHIVMDRETQRPRGFAFVSYASDEVAAKAAQEMNGRSFGGRPLVVNEARERGEGPPPGARPSGPRPGGYGDRPPRPGGFGDRPPRPPGSGPGGPRPGGFRGPRGAPMPPPEPLPTEERRPRTAPKKKVDYDRDRAPSGRPREDEEEKGGASWRQWIDEDE